MSLLALLLVQRLIVGGFSSTRLDITIHIKLGLHWLASRGFVRLRDTSQKQVSGSVSESIIPVSTHLFNSYPYACTHKRENKTSTQCRCEKWNKHHHQLVNDDRDDDGNER